MDLDLRGRVRNTHLSSAHCLLPLYEAIINAIHAVSGVSNATIDVQLVREKAQGALSDGETIMASPIVSFLIHDNGVGFTDENYRAFQTSDSTHKAAECVHRTQLATNSGVDLDTGSGKEMMSFPSP